MSIIRNLLYNGSSFDALHSGILYNQTLLHNFIVQHQPKFILHCGCPENALNLAYFAKENQPCEILHVKNWNPTVGQWLQATGEHPNPHKAFIDKISEYKLEDYLISFDGLSVTAAEILSYRNFSFNMMISDTIGDSTDYMPLLKLLQKNASHIRFIGNKKISEIKNEPIFQADIEISFTYAQGYLITGMDYLSLYDAQDVPSIPQKIQDYAVNYIPQPNRETNRDNDDIYNKEYDNHHGLHHQTSQKNSINDTHIPQKIEHHSVAPIQKPTPQPLSPREEREQRRLERRKEREERRQQRQEIDNTPNVNNDKKDDTAHTTYANNTQIESKENNHNQSPISQLIPFEVEDNGESTISAARRALRARRAARRQGLLNITNEKN